LPGLKRDMSLSTFQAGLLVAAYSVGAVVFAIPAVMVAARVGVRTTALASLTALAITSVAFGVADSYAGLIASRFVQGMAGAACFTSAMVWLLEVAPARRRGVLLGLAFGVSEAGSIAGPVVGGVAAAIGRAAMFAGVAGGSAALALATLPLRGPPPPGMDRFPLPPLLAAPHVLTTALIILIPAAILAAVSVLAPLQQHRLGARVGEIAATFGVAAAAGILVRPVVGRWSDRRGPRGPVRFGLLASFPVVL